MFEKKLNVGDEVLIFTESKFDEINNDFNELPFIKGKVIKCGFNGDLKYHGNSWNKNKYIVMDEDENLYMGFYNFGVPRFLTEEDYIERLGYIIDRDNEEIKEKLERIKRMKDIILSLKVKEKVLSKKK